MLLSAQLLTDVNSANSFLRVNHWSLTNGDSGSFYFILIDLEKDKTSDGFKFGGRRYVPATGATLQIVIENLDQAKQFARTATNPFPGDTSIWSFGIVNTDFVAGTSNLRLTLNEGVKVTSGVVKAALRGEPLTSVG